MTAAADLRASGTRRLVLLALLVAAVGVLVRLPALFVPILNEDEALYAATAARMAEGLPIYRAGVESKPPGIFYLYRAAFALVGRYHMIALHALTILWVLATAWLVARLARRAAPAGASRDHAALLGALGFLVFSTVHEPKILATQCEILYTLPLSAAALLLLRADRARAPLPRLGGALLAGLLVGLGTLIKPTAASLLVAALARPLLLRRRAGSRFLDGAATSAALLVGFGVAWLAAWLWFSHLGVWGDLVYWSFRWTTGIYVPTGFAASPIARRLLGSFLPWLGLTVGPWVAALALIAAAVRAARRREDAPWLDAVALLGLWLAVATAATTVGGRFYDHYFPAVIPPLAALGGAGAARLLATAGDGARRRLRTAIALAIALPGLLCLVAAARFDAALRLLGDPRPPIADVARYLQGHSAAHDRIFVWGYYPLLYVAADRLPASRFVGCHYLTGYAALGLSTEVPPAVEDRLGVPGGLDTLLDELSREAPALLVDTAPANLHGWRRYPLDRYPRLAAFVRERYERIATVDGAVVYRRRDAR